MIDPQLYLHTHYTRRNKGENTVSRAAAAAVGDVAGDQN